VQSFDSFLPLIGVVIGWILKSGTDFLASSYRERIARRKCTFYLLRAWKALLDYERVIRLLTSNRPAVDEYEPMRAHFAARLLSRLTEDKDSLATGVDMLASVDPTAAAQLDNTLKNIKWGVESGFAQVIESDPAAYVEAMNSHNDLIDWTLSDFQDMAERLAKRSGFLQKRKVSKWFLARIEGGKEFTDGIKSFEDRLHQRRTAA
jgi:hypothetical protein